jgi:hypothetical protein
LPLRSSSLFFSSRRAQKLWILKEFAGKVAELLSSMQMNYNVGSGRQLIGVIVLSVIIAALLIVSPHHQMARWLRRLLLMGFSGFALYYTYVLHAALDGALSADASETSSAVRWGVKTCATQSGVVEPAIVVFFEHGSRVSGWISENQADS